MLMQPSGILSCYINMSAGDLQFVSIHWWDSLRDYAKKTDISDMKENRVPFTQYESPHPAPNVLYWETLKISSIYLSSSIVGRFSIS